jgi:hypothetical protein
MKKSLYLFLALCICSLASVSVFAQDEGKVVVKQRFERDKTFYFSLGPSFVFGKTLGDYHPGFNVEAGFLKRINKLLSVGPSLNYLAFTYDPSKTYHYYYNEDVDHTYNVFSKGGDLSILSAGVNFKLNFIPVSDDTKFSVYGIINPFVSYVMRTGVTGSYDIYEKDPDTGNYTQFYDHVDYDYTSGTDGLPALKKTNKVTGGAHLGVGFEFQPAKKLSFFGQATFSYSLPVTYVSTKSFLHPEDIYTDSSDGRIYYDSRNSFDNLEWPIVKKAFSAVSLKVGMAYNF